MSTFDEAAVERAASAAHRRAGLSPLARGWSWESLDNACQQTWRDVVIAAHAAASGTDEPLVVRALREAAAEFAEDPDCCARAVGSFSKSVLADAGLALVRPPALATVPRPAAAEEPLAERVSP